MAKPVRFRGKWRIRPIGEDGARESYVFDTHVEALRKLKQREHEVDEVRRGARAATPPPKRFCELCDYWIEHRVPAKRSGDHDKSIINRHLRPMFGDVLLRDLSVKHVDVYVGSDAVESTELRVVCAYAENHAGRDLPADVTEPTMPLLPQFAG